MVEFNAIHLTSERYKELLKAEIILQAITKIYEGYWHEENFYRLLSPFLAKEKMQDE